MMAPLDGIHVLDLSLLLPGPLCGQILRDLGARVTKIEPPSPGDYMALWPPMVGDVSATYFAVNRGKTVVSLNLKDPSDRQRFLEDYVPSADVVLDGFRPGVLDKLGVGYRLLAERNPGIVVASITGYGQTGPAAQRAGHDLNYQAMAGVLSLSGGDSAGPPNPQLQVADTAAGSYAAAMLILAALLQRQRTGRGRHLDISMSEQLLPLMTPTYATCQALDQVPTRDGELLSGRAPCYRAYRTQDGRYLTLGALEPKFWSALVEALGRPELLQWSHLGEDGHGPELAGLLAELVATRPLAEWVELLGPADACVEPVLDLDEVQAWPQWQARGSFLRVTAPDGRVLNLPKMPGSLAGFETSDNQGPPPGK